jgi:hypothetical protein
MKCIQTDVERTAQSAMVLDADVVTVPVLVAAAANTVPLLIAFAPGHLCPTPWISPVVV